MRNTLLRGVVLASALAAVGCSPSSTPATGEATGGAGGTVSNGGSSTKSTTSSKANTGGSKATTKTGKGGNSAATGNEGGASEGGEGATEGGESSGGAASSSKSGSAKGGSSSSKSGSAATGGTKTSGSGSSTGGANEGGASSTATEGGSTGEPPVTGVTVQLDKTKQEMAGFGINNNWAPGMTDAEADAMFDVNKGLGFSILRIGMNADGTHFNSSNPQDIAKAKARGAKYIIGTTWSPPGSCKTNGQENDGGHLLESCYGSWSDKIAKFAADNSLYAMSIGNEPDFASCGTAEPCNGNYPTTLYTANEMVAFIKVAGPKLQKAGVKVIAPEASEWIHNWSNESATGSEPGNKNSSDPLKCGFPATTKCDDGSGYDYGHFLYKDKDAWAALDIMGVHQYDTQVAEPWPADVPEKKPVWQTEMSGVKWWPEQGVMSGGVVVNGSTTIENGVAVAGWVHNALTVGEASAWLWWWWKAISTNNNEGLLLKDGTDTKRRYTFGNYSRFIRPGYVRVDIAGSDSKDILLSAFKGTDGTVVIVAINKSTTAQEVPITITGGTAPASLTPWVTSKSDNLKSGTAVPVSDGKFTAKLVEMSVTTFVGK